MDEAPTILCTPPCVASQARLRRFRLLLDSLPLFLLGFTAEFYRSRWTPTLRKRSEANSCAPWRDERTTHWLRLENAVEVVERLLAVVSAVRPDVRRSSCSACLRLLSVEERYASGK